MDGTRALPTRRDNPFFFFFTRFRRFMCIFLFPSHYPRAAIATDVGGGAAFAFVRSRQATGVRGIRQTDDGQNKKK